MKFHTLVVLFALAGAVSTKEAPTAVDQEALPTDAVFPGLWDRYIQAPKDKSFIRPRALKAVKGYAYGLVDSLFVTRQDDGTEVPKATEEDIQRWVASGDHVQSRRWVAKDGLTRQKIVNQGPRRREMLMGRGDLLVLDFEENIAGRVCFNIAEVEKDVFLALTYSESPEFANANGDATTDSLWTDLPLYFPLQKGTNCVGKEFNRGAFRFLSVRVPADSNEDKGFWHTGSPDFRRLAKADKSICTWLKCAWNTFKQFVISFDQSNPHGFQKPQSTPEPWTKPLLAMSQLWVNSTAFPSNPNPRAYTGYFYSSSHLLNRIWYAGAYTLQLSTIDPKEGSALIDYNRRIDHNQSPHGTWYSNFTISKGKSVTTDGAKRDRMVWPGDMSIAVPGIAVSTHDMEAVRNALEVIFDHQYSDGSLPYAGPPMGYGREFSDTYHLHTLLGTYNYVLYSGDIDWLAKHWKAYKVALAISIAKVDDLGLLHVTSTADWLRPGMSGHNLEASALLLSVLQNTFALDRWLSTSSPAETSSRHTAQNEKEIWTLTMTKLTHGIEKLYCPESGMYADNLEEAWCGEPRHVLPQDGNSWVLLTHNPPLPSRRERAERLFEISDLLRRRWLKHGAPAPEFPNVISPFTSSFELLGHCAIGEVDTAVELMLSMWGYMLNGPGMTNSTCVEGYRTDGYAQYPAYWSPARGSHAHGWSTGPTTALTGGVLGIQFGEPAGKFWVVRPELTRWLSFARGGTSTKLGKWEVKIKRLRSRDGRIGETLQVNWPKGTTGRVEWGGEVFVLNHTIPEDAKDGMFKANRWVEGGKVYVLFGPHSGLSEQRSKEVEFDERDREGRIERVGFNDGPFGLKFGWQYLLESIVEADEGDWRSRVFLVPDWQWKAPDLPERPVGKVDWKKMEEIWLKEIPAGVGMPPWRKERDVSDAKHLRGEHKGETPEEL